MSRKGGWIHTVSGSHFYPEDIRPEDFHIYDIAHALANLNRFCGHTSFPYSVAQHSVLCSRVAAPGYELSALLHDAAEAYITDLPTPIKVLFPEYIALENRILDAIDIRFGVDTRNPEVQAADRGMLVTEARVLCNPIVNWYVDDRYPEPFDIYIEQWSPQQARHVFLQRFAELRQSAIVSA